MVDSLSKDGVSIKRLVEGNLNTALTMSEMLNQEIEVNRVNKTRTTDGEDVVPNKAGISDLASVDGHLATESEIKHETRKSRRRK